jgi:hypothetical protein
MDVISVADDDVSVRSATVDLLNSVGFPCEDLLACIRLALAGRDSAIRSEPDGSSQ